MTSVSATCPMTTTPSGRTTAMRDGGKVEDATVNNNVADTR